MAGERLRAPFPWFGGKSLASPLIWRAFGNVPNYVEPFAGSLAVLLARPGGAGKVETANDKDGLISNFWRAIRDKPDEVARYADWPVNEADLHARHRWLVAQAPALLERLIADPEYSDPKIAGWWIWGICTWIGNGWCSRDERLHHRVLGRSTLGIDTAHGMTPCGVLLDPPYAHDHRDKRLYREDDADLSGLVRAWALEHGDNPALRIALCGWDGEHEMPSTWTRVPWKSKGSGKNRGKERIWFSPHCLPAERAQTDLNLGGAL